MQTENVRRKTEYVDEETFKRYIGDHLGGFTEETVIVTRNGKPIAVLTPYHRPLTANEEEALFARFKEARQRILDQSGMSVAQFEAIFDDDSQTAS